MAISSVGNGSTIDKVISQQNSSNSAKRNVGGEMGKDQFLSLLISQLQHQDPLNPVDDKEFIGQMAQFTQLEQLQNMNSSFASMRGTSFLGKIVKGSFVDPVTKESKDVDGIVTDITISKDGVTALVNGQSVPVEKITDITENGVLNKQQDLAQYTGYLGFLAKAQLSDSNNNVIKLEGIVKEVSKGENSPEALLDNVTLEYAEIKSGEKIVSASEKYDYLTGMKGKEISGYVRNDKGEMISVTGTLQSFTLREAGSITVNLNDVKVPVNGISGVTFPE